MPRFAVELEYLVPVWTTVVVEADDDNHVKAAADDADCWDHAETDYDSCTRIELVLQLGLGADGAGKLAHFIKVLLVLDDHHWVNFPLW